MRKSFKRIAFVAAVAVLLLAPAATANAAGDSGNCAGNGCNTEKIAANSFYHCLKFTAHRGAGGDMSYGVLDDDSTQYIVRGTIHWWWSPDQSGTIYGLYGQHYYGYIYNSASSLSWIEITNDCS